MSEDVPVRCELNLHVPEELLDALAELVAARVGEQLPTRVESLWR